MDTTVQIDRPSPRETRRRGFGPLLAAAGALLLVLASRFVTSDLAIHTSVIQRSCQSGYCVERIHAPDLLFVPGFRRVQLAHDAKGADKGRHYVEDDPFDDHSQVKIRWENGGVSLTDGAATLTWDAQAIGRLDH